MTLLSIFTDTFSSFNITARSIHWCRCLFPSKWGHTESCWLLRSSALTVYTASTTAHSRSGACLNAKTATLALPALSSSRASGTVDHLSAATPLIIGSLQLSWLHHTCVSLRPDCRDCEGASMQIRSVSFIRQALYIPHGFPFFLSFSLSLNRRRARRTKHYWGELILLWH
jgi:hypothetical protein